MKKHIVITILLSFVVATAEAQLLYRISGGGLKEPSFMLGTVHNLPGSLLDSIPEYAEAEAQCQQMYVEGNPVKYLKNKFRNKQDKPQRQELSMPESVKDYAQILNYYEHLVQEWEQWGDTVSALVEEDLTKTKK